MNILGKYWFSITQENTRNDEKQLYISQARDFGTIPFSYLTT